jgi:hypothetical protein
VGRDPEISSDLILTQPAGASDRDHVALELLGVLRRHRDILPVSRRPTLDVNQSWGSPTRLIAARVATPTVAPTESSVSGVRCHRMRAGSDASDAYGVR